MKCQNLFSGKNKKKYFKMSSAEIFTQSAKRIYWHVIPPDISGEQVYCE